MQRRFSRVAGFPKTEVPGKRRDGWIAADQAFAETGSAGNRERRCGNAAPVAGTGKRQPADATATAPIGHCAERLMLPNLSTIQCFPDVKAHAK